MGYVFKEIDIQTLREFVEEEYSEVTWTEFVYQDVEGIDLWGWADNGEYVVAVAVPFLRSEDEVKHIKALMQRIEQNKVPSESEIIREGWLVKVMHQCEGPIAQPSKEFLKTKPRHLRRIK